MDSSRRLRGALALGWILACSASSASADSKVCVSVEIKRWTASGERAVPVTAARAPGPAPVNAPVSEQGDAAAPPPTGAPADPAAAPGTAPPAAAPPVAGAVAPSRSTTAPGAVRPNATVRPAEPVGVKADLYLKRLMEYEVTHAVGFEAVQEGCNERITVELYVVRGGYTVFARFSGNAREEKVDYVQLDEVAALAQRLTQALLTDRSIAHTMTRENVLRADSEQNIRAVKGRGHFAVSAGTTLRAGVLPTGPEDPDSVEPASDEFRLQAPVSLAFGYRGKYRALGVEALGRFDFGTSKRATSRNQGGGHADFSVGLGMALHGLHYLDPSGMTSFYLGGGASFDLLRYTLIEAQTEYNEGDREPLWSGGLNLDVVVGHEFMRSSSLQFFVQLDLKLPTFVVNNENDAGRIQAYLPGAVFHVGALL
jgi:hypothetical protein